jgi:DNA-binding CsgD family transcriptional regulator
MTAALPPTDLRRRRADLLRQAAAAPSVTEVFGAASQRLHDLVPHESSAWLMTDPATGLPSAPSLLDDFTAPIEVCTEHWHREYVDPDVNHFRRLARAELPAAALRATTTDPERSARFRWFLRPLGIADELRWVLRVGGTPWAMVTLWRREGAKPFTTAEADLLAGMSEPLGDAVRHRVREGHPAVAAQGVRQPGLLTFDAQDRLISVNEYAAAWLDELPQQELVGTDFGLRVPVWMLVTAQRARRSLAAGEDGVARTRVRSRGGRWVVGHASTTRDAQGAPNGTAVTIEPASPALMAPVFVEAYGLTEREQEISRQIARGAGTGEIARALFLSPHTVRDHVKSILAKVGVANRGELVARLYAEQFEPAHLAAMASGG